MFFVFFLFCVGASSFGCVTIANREMKTCQRYLIYDKTNSDVASNSDIKMYRRLFTMMQTRKSEC